MHYVSCPSPLPSESFLEVRTKGRLLCFALISQNGSDDKEEGQFAWRLEAPCKNTVTYHWDHYCTQAQTKCAVHLWDHIHECQPTWDLQPYIHSNPGSTYEKSHVGLSPSTASHTQSVFLWLHVSLHPCLSKQVFFFLRKQALAKKIPSPGDRSQSRRTSHHL